MDESLMLNARSPALAKVFAKNGVMPNSKAAFPRKVVDGVQPLEVAVEFRLKANAACQLKHRAMETVGARLAETRGKPPAGDAGLEGHCQVLEGEP